MLVLVNISVILFFPFSFFYFLDEETDFMILCSQFLRLESVSGLIIGGNVLPMSVMAKGLAMPKQSIPIPAHLMAPSTTLDDKHVKMLIGVASKSTEFERRMGVRRSWAQYPLIHSGHVLLRFFVGLVVPIFRPHL